MVARGWAGGGMGSWYLMGVEFVWEDEKAQEVDGGAGGECT